MGPTILKKQKPKLRIIPLGGLEEVGRNMMVIEYGREIIIIDMGLQFPEEDMHGIDYIIPNISYLRGKENFIRGVIITHGHYDHIGAIPHLIGKLGNPTIFTAKLTAGIIRKRQEDFKNNQAKLNIYTVKSSDKLQLGPFKVEFLHVNHNIPDVLSVVVHTPEGTLMHTGDFKFDDYPVNDKPTDAKKIERLGKQGITVLFSDSTGSETPGNTISEKTIGESMEKILKQAKGRIIIGTFASLLSRIQQIVWLAEKLGKKVVVEGYSMKTNIEIAKELGYFKVKPNTIVTAKEIKRLPKKKIIILCTGAQGEGKAALMRIANREHREIRIEKGDTIIFSSSVIPGNENTVQKLKDSLTREGADIIHYQMMDVHAGGHAAIEDLKRMIRLAKPKYLVPVHGNRYMLKLHGDIGKQTGLPEKNIFIMDNGQILEFEQGQAKLQKKKVPADHVMVDGLGVGDVSHIVLRDRQMMAEDGMFVVIVTIDSKTGKLIGSPDIISRGFIYMKENKKLIEDTRNKVRNILIDKDSQMAANDEYIKNKIRNQIGEFLYQKTERRPMVLPVVIAV